MRKRKDECLFCTSRSCFERVVSSGDNGQLYDEIACTRHVSELHRHSDKKAPGVKKNFISSIGRQKRGDPV